MKANTIFDSRDITGKLLLLFFIIVFVFKAYADLSQIDNSYFVDLRNRVVGARLMDQHRSPYFFKWDASQPETLFDPYDKCNISNNMTTSPPSVLFLMKPLANLNYSEICYWWAAIHYFFFLLIVIPIYLLFKNSASRYLILIISCLLLLSDHWRDSVFRGQSHFVFPAVIAISLWVNSTRLSYRHFLIGSLISFLLWTRPNAALLIPFLFLCNGVNKKQLFAGLASGLGVFGLLTLLLQHQNYWFEFYLTCKEWIRNNTSGIPMSACHSFTFVEGKLMRFPPGYPRVTWQSEIVNIYHLAEAKLKFRIPAMYLTALFAAAYIAALFFSFKKRFTLFSTALIAAVLLYWLSEMTAPVLKMSYYYIELFPVVLFLAGSYRYLSPTEKILLASSLLLTFISFIPMNLTLAEFSMIGCMIYWVWFNSIKE